METKAYLWQEEEMTRRVYKTCLDPEFDHLPPEQVYKEYEMDVPKDVLEFCKIIEKIGGRVLLVGGCVRDAILSVEKGKGKIQPKDIDMEVYGIYPEDLLREVGKHFELKDSGTYGKQFEVIKVFGRDGTYDLDISIPRADNKTGVDSKGFETTSHPEYKVIEAAVRRDLTCNSVSYDPLRRVVFDPYDGVKDIKENVLRATDPIKFAEDPVRILRIMQFVARFEGTIDPETEALCKKMVTDIEGMKHLKYERIIVGGDARQTDDALKYIDKSPIELDNQSKNRIYDEFVKLLLKGKKPSLGLEFARRVGVIDRYFPWLAELTITEQEHDWHPEGNAWKHTLQVVDAAAGIMRREKMSEEEGIVFMLAALSHDLGKPTKTEKKVKNGVMAITSDGHDMEGGWMSEEFINAFAPAANVKILRNENGDYVGLDETDFAKEIRARVRILTEKHMQLKAWYLEYKKKKAVDPEKAEKQSRKWLGGLARKLAEKGTSIFALSFLTEADQRGRNGENDTPLEKSEVEDLENWQAWMNERVGEVKIEKVLPKKIVDGDKIKEILKMKADVELGVVDSYLFDDQLAGEFVRVEDGLERARAYKDLVMSAISTAEEEGWKTAAMPGKKKGPRLQDEICKWLKEDGVREKIVFNTRLAVLEKMADKNTQRVAELGEWPKRIKRETLVERIPNEESGVAPGFDAGVACALGLIPEEKQKLAASLHANYTPESVEQIRREIESNDPDSPTTWWLAACAVCKEGKITAEEFLNQVDEFKRLAKNPEERLERAKKEFEKMTSSFEIVNGVPFGTEDGCMQGAYLAGYKVALMYAKEDNVYFVGTYLPSLGLPEDFPWSNETDELKRPKSGPVFGSKQFVKCKNEDEVKKVLSEIKIKFRE